MTELLLPGAGIPAIPEVIQPTRTSSAKSGSTDFSGILRRAAESLRQAGATEPAYRTSSLFSGSLPFADTNSATFTENIVLPVSRSELSLLADDTIRVVADPIAMLGSDVRSPDAASIVPVSTGSTVAFSDPETCGGEALQQMQDVLHTLAGLVTTLLEQNQGQSVSTPAMPALPVGNAENSIDILPPHSTTEVSTGVPSTIPVAVDKSGENPISQSKEVLLPVVKTQKNIKTATVNETGAFVLSVMPNGENRQEITVQEAEISALLPKVLRENVGSEPTPTGDSEIQQVEKDMLPPTSDTVIGTDVQTAAKTKPIDTGVVEQRQTDRNTVSDDTTDRLLVFVPSIGLVTIRPEPAEDGALTINVEVPREIPPTPAALHNLLGDITGAVQNLLPKNEKTQGESTISPIVPNKQMGGGDVLAHQTVETNENVVPTVLPVPTIQNDPPNKVGIETDGRDAVSAVATDGVSTRVPEKANQAARIQNPDMAQSQPTNEQVSDSSQVVAHNEVKTTGLAHNLSVSGDTSAVSTNIHSLASTVVVQQTIDNPFAAKITEIEQRHGTQSELRAQNSKEVQVPMSSPIETAKVNPASDSSTATSRVEPTITPENSDSSATPKQADIASYPTIKTIHLTFTATPKQKIDIPAIVPDIYANRTPVTSAPVHSLSDTPAVSGDTSNDNDSIHEVFTGQNDIPQLEVLDKESQPVIQPVIAITPEVSSTTIADTPISFGQFSNEGTAQHTAVPKSNHDGLQANVPIQLTDESASHLATQKVDNILPAETGIGDESKVQQKFVSTAERGAVVSTVRENIVSNPNIPTRGEFVQPEVVSNPVLASDPPIVSSVSDVDVSTMVEPAPAISPSADDAPKVLSSVAPSAIADSDIPAISKPVQAEAGSSPVAMSNSPIVQSEIVDSDIRTMINDTVDVSSAPASVNVESHPLQVESSGMQAFFPYIKPEQQPQEHIDLPRPEESDIVIPVVPEPEQSELATDNGIVGAVPATEKTGIGVPSAGDSSHSGMIPTPVGSQYVTTDDKSEVLSHQPVAEIEYTISTEGTDIIATAAEETKNNISASTPADRIVATVEPDDDTAIILPKKEQKTLPVDATMREQDNWVEPTNESQIEGTNSKNKSAVGTAPFPAQSGNTSTDNKTSLYDIVEPLPVRLQTNGDMVGLDALLREAQRSGATVTRLSITMPQQVSEMNTLSPKANSNQLDRTVSNNTVIKKAEVPFLRADPEVSEGIDKLVNVHLPENQEVSEPLYPISHESEPRLPAISNIGTSIEDLSGVQQEVRGAVGSARHRTPLQSEPPTTLFTQQMSGETARSDNSSMGTGQPLVATNEVNSLQHPLGNDGVVQEREKISPKKVEDPTLAKNSNYGIPQLQDGVQGVEKPILVQAGGRTDIPQAVGSREIYTSTSLPADRISVPVAPDNVPATGHNEVTEVMASGVYQATVRPGTPVRTTAGRLSAARNAVESLRENTTPVAAATDRGEVVVADPVMRTNNVGQEHSQTPFRQESQNPKNDIVLQNERSVSVAGSESYRNVADHSTELVGSEDIRNKNTIRPESIHPGIPLPMMPKIATPVVRMYRNVAQHEIPEVVQTAVRTFPSGSGGTVQMTLAPESLGEVLVAISVRDSIAEVRIDTETNESRKLVEAQLPALREKLTQAGLQVDHIEVRTKPQDTVQSDASRSGRQGSQTQEEQKSRQDFVRSFRHLASDEGREQPDIELKRTNPYRIRGGNFERYA